MLGVTVHIAEHFSNVTTISFLLDREIEGYGGGMRLAGSRSALLQSIGAENIVITPRPEPEHAGQFVVAATWQYNQQNLASLNAALAVEWKIFGDRMTHADTGGGRTPRANAWLRRFLQRRGRVGGGREPG